MRLLMVSESAERSKTLLPSLEFLDHELTTASLSPEVVAHLDGIDVAVVDATADVPGAATACRSIAASDNSPPVLVVASEGQLAALKPTWGFEDWVLPSAQPAEIETRLRLVSDREQQHHRQRGTSIGDLSIDEDTYVVRLRGHPLDLTFREFELLTYLAHNPERVFTRAQLLQAVWGFDYYGGTRTVDVHIRRLRAKLGPEHESLIGTVRGVGYKLDPHGASHTGEPDQAGSDDD